MITINIKQLGVGAIVSVALIAVYLFMTESAANHGAPITRDTDKNTRITSIKSSLDKNSGKPVVTYDNNHDDSVAAAKQKPDQAPAQTNVKKQVANHEQRYYAMSVNDPYVDQDWSVTKIKAAKAWDIMPAIGSTIAIIDSGYALEHEDLVNQWIMNPGELGSTKAGDVCWTGVTEDKQSNNCDDDSNGYIDDWRGWDFANIDNHPQAGTTNPEGDGTDHGTIVAGLAGAETNNGIGVASVGRYHKLMPLQVLDDDGVGYTSDIMAAVYYAVDNGADVINMSLGGNGADANLKQALDYAEQHDVVLIAAAGNCGQPNDDPFCSGLPAGGMTYPAQYTNVISVGATTDSDQRASFSSYGSLLDVSAPGAGSIISTMWLPTNETSSYATNLYGTSFASPIVASIAGIIKAQNPYMDNKVLKQILIANAMKPTSMNGQPYTTSLGHGVVDAYQAAHLSQSLPLEEKPELFATGNIKAEHFYSVDTPAGTGCKTNAHTYCGVWMQSTNSLDRYLPYKQTNENGEVSWSWNTSMLSSLVWNVRSTHNSHYSAEYVLLSK